MKMKWLINIEEKRFQLNFSSYSSLYANYTTNENYLVELVNQFFQSRSKIKDLISIKNLSDDNKELNNHSFTTFKLSNQLLLEERKLGSKSLLKSQIMDEFYQHIETDGYLLTINTLINDLLNTVVDELPVKMKDISIDSIMKFIEIDFSQIKGEDGANRIFNQNKVILDTIKHFVKNKSKHSSILIFEYPELYLSPKEQLQMKSYLMNLSKEIFVFVVTNSKHFLSQNFNGLNYFSFDKQVMNDDLLDDLEWDSPVPYNREELENSLVNICKRYIDMFEIKPVISNYNQSDIIVFKNIDLYVLVYFLNKLKFKYDLDLDHKIIDKPVLRYVMDIYENI